VRKLKIDRTYLSNALNFARIHRKYTYLSNKFLCEYFHVGIMVKKMGLKRFSNKFTISTQKSAHKIRAHWANRAPRMSTVFRRLFRSIWRRAVAHLHDQSCPGQVPYADQLCVRAADRSCSGFDLQSSLLLALQAVQNGWTWTTECRRSNKLQQPAWDQKAASR